MGTDVRKWVVLQRFCSLSPKLRKLFFKDKNNNFRYKNNNFRYTNELNLFEQRNAYY